MALDLAAREPQIEPLTRRTVNSAEIYGDFNEILVGLYRSLMASAVMPSGVIHLLGT